MALSGFAGCTQGTPGGPGATDSKAKKPLLGEADNTFNLSVPRTSTTIDQGGTKEVTVGIKRGKNLDQEVTLAFTDLPKGLTIDPATPAIKQEETETTVKVTATDDASLGDFSVKVTGHPTKGGDATVDLKLTVAKQKVGPKADATAAAVKAKQDKYVHEMHDLLATLDVKYEELKGRAAKSEGEAKKELDKKLAEAKVKRDAAAKKLEELKTAGATRWEKIKEGVGSAFADLKKVFE
jgi:hypothetical protein